MQRRDALLALAAGAVSPALARADTSAAGAARSANLTAEIEALLRRTEETWNAQDTAKLRDLWDRDDADPYYLAGEQENWFIGWDQLNRYLVPQGRRVVDAIRVKFYDVHARLLAPDLAFAAFWMRTDMKVVFSPKPFGSDNRVSAVLRRKSDGWRYICYAEAFQAPTLYFQKLTEKDVAPDYAEFYQHLKERKP